MRIAIYILLALLGLFLLLLLLLMPRRRTAAADRLLSRPYAHRGLHGAGIPENSLSAFEAACRRGVGIELDVQLSADGVLMVFHDESLLRVTGADGSLYSRSYEELSALRLLGTEERIPTLAEVLSLVRGRVPLLVEIKSDHAWQRVCEKTAELLDGYTGEYMIESFHPLAVAWFAKHRPATVRGQLSSRLTREEQYKGFSYFLVEHLLLNILARPDFIAYDGRYPNAPMLRLCYGVYRPYLVGWTPRGDAEAAALVGKFDQIIFEDLSDAALAVWQRSTQGNQSNM